MTREKPHMPKPEEQEGIPQHRHNPLAKHREDRNPKHHDEQQKDGARIVAAHPPNTGEREHTFIYEQNVACGHNSHNAMSESLKHPCLESMNCHQNSQAINQLSRHVRQPASILESEDSAVINQMNRRRVKYGGSVEVHIKFAPLISKYKIARK
jgi:hypothetical protein